MRPLAAVAAASVDRQALIPMAAGYLILMSALALGLRRLYRPRAKRQQAGQPADSSRRGGRVFARRVTGTVVGGWLVLMAAVIGYYYGVAKVGSDFVESAATGTALLIGLAAPVYAAASWLTERPRHHRGHQVDADSRRR